MTLKKYGIIKIMIAKMDLFSIAFALGLEHVNALNFVIVSQYKYKILRQTDG